ncbi:MAG TPA: hypothetical protein VK453_28105 [Micromonosporaceae bacterium]|nr:hypothetical protein [Micromonosporaceae bacterium]
MRRDRVGSVVAVASAAAGAAAVLALTGCSGPAPAAAPSETPSAVSTVEPRAQLAARVAAAKDRHFVAGYTVTVPKGKARAVMATVAQDGTWRVDIQGGALGGSADIAVVGRPDGTYQCALAGGPDKGCVRVAEAGGKLPATIDPRIPYAFSSWLDVLTDRQLPLSVAGAEPLAGASGTCFSVEPVAVALAPPIDPGVFCYADDGTLTGARAAFGTLLLSGPPAPGPATVPLPGVTVSRAALPLAAPPPPPPPPTTAAASPSSRPATPSAAAKPTTSKKPSPSATPRR